MALHPKIKLSEIRKIGWACWDPIGLHDGSEFGPEACADEYDNYLPAVVSMLCRGGTRAEAAAYLTDIARNYIGLSYVDDRASADTVDRIATYLSGLPDAPAIAGS